jgi:hypothetical protein
MCLKSYNIIFSLIQIGLNLIKTLNFFLIKIAETLHI